MAITYYFFFFNEDTLEINATTDELQIYVD